MADQQIKKAPRLCVNADCCRQLQIGIVCCRCELDPHDLDVGDVYYSTTKAMHLMLHNVGQVGMDFCSICEMLRASEVQQSAWMRIGPCVTMNN